VAHSIEQWLKHLDAILEHYQFETMEEAEVWLREQSASRSVDEFFHECATPAMRLAFLRQQAEDAEDPALAHAAFEAAILHAESTLAEEIAAARANPDGWPESKAHPYLHALFGRAATAEMCGQFSEAELFYQQTLATDPLDSLGCAEKLFSLCVIDGRLADARQWLDRVTEESTVVLYHRALLRFLEAADEAEQAYQRTGDLATASSWQDAQADALLSIALERNPYVARLMSHPRAFSLDCPHAYALGSADEAVAVMYASAHLWLSDLLALSWLLGASKKLSLTDEDWQSLLEKLGGEACDEERFAYLRQLEEIGL
jgi:tetratricopeptide (TPR) repeat protein